MMNYILKLVNVNDGDLFFQRLQPYLGVSVLQNRQHYPERQLLQSYRYTLTRYGKNHYCLVKIINSLIE